MDVLKASELAIKQIKEMSDEEFLDMFYKASGINRHRSRLYFRLKEARNLNYQMKELEEDIQGLQDELNKLKKEQEALLIQIKASIAH